MTSLPGGQLGFLIVVNLLVFFLAFFLDFFELSFIVIPLLGPVAEKLGIDLIWFGVLLGVNMQTSFMHPPFGFALFYLRSVAPAKEYRDKITGKMMAPITTMQIYWGAVPFVIIQVLMVGLVILFPQMVMVYKSDASTVDPSKLEIVIPQGESQGPAEGQPPPAGAEVPKSESEDDAAKALQDAFKTAPAPGGAAPPQKLRDDAPRADGKCSRSPRRRQANYSAARCAQEKSPATRGAFFGSVAQRRGDRRRRRYFFGAAGAARVAAIMKLSKRFSATLNHRSSSSRNFFHGS